METRHFIFAFVGVTCLLALLGLIPLPMHLMARFVPAAQAAVVAAPAQSGPAVATFAGGCFWPQQEDFRELRGVQNVVAGYAGGTAQHPTYEQVVQGGTGHAEAVQVYYNPQQISYQQLLNVFFLGTHDPTQLNRQDPDAGPVVRSIAFYRTPQEQQLIQATIRRVDASHRYSAPIVTQVVPFRQFWSAEAYHQGYYRRHLTDDNIAHSYRPRVERFQQAFPALLKPVASR